MYYVKKGPKSFYIGEDENKPMAEISFVVSGEKTIIIDHTFVSEELKGKGIGNMLLQELVDWTRKQKKKIVPLCPYSKAQMEKNKEYHDMIL